jgi:hypothetical protein
LRFQEHQLRPPAIQLQHVNDQRIPKTAIAKHSIDLSIRIRLFLMGEGRRKDRKPIE